MRVINLGDLYLSDPLPGGPLTLDRRDVLLEVLRGVDQTGATISHMDEVCDLIDKIKAAADKLVLEEREWEIMQKKFDAFRFNRIDKGILLFRKEIGNSEKIEAVALVAPAATKSKRPASH